MAVPADSIDSMSRRRRSGRQGNLQWELFDDVAVERVPGIPDDWGPDPPDGADHAMAMEDAFGADDDGGAEGGYGGDPFQDDGLDNGMPWLDEDEDGLEAEDMHDDAESWLFAALSADPQLVALLEVTDEHEVIVAMPAYVYDEHKMGTAAVKHAAVLKDPQASSKHQGRLNPFCILKLRGMAFSDCVAL